MTVRSAQKVSFSVDIADILCPISQGPICSRGNPVPIHKHALFDLGLGGQKTPKGLQIACSKDGGTHRRKGMKMLWTIFVILLVLWLLGVVTSYTLGGFIHVLLVIALVVVLINVIQGRRVV